MWARADLRARWRSWLVLGLLAGVTFGFAAAGMAGARRADRAVPRYLAASGPRLDAAILPNDPAFDADVRARVAALAEVARAYPFVVAFALSVPRPGGLGGDFPGLLPTTAGANRVMANVIVDGRVPDPRRADEIAVDEAARDRFGLDLGATMVIEQSVTPELRAQLPPEFVPPGDDLDFRQRLRVVGIMKTVDENGGNFSPSSGFARKYADRLIGPTNMFLTLRRGEADFSRFRRDVQRIVGRPVNVESGTDLLRLRQTRNIAGIERDGLLLFALAVVVVGGVLVGQALVRAVSAGGADADTWRALGADRSLMIVAMTVPTFLVAAAGAIVAVIVAIALSPRLPIGSTRRIDIDIGVHADWPVLGIGVLVLVVGTLTVAVVSAWWRTARGEVGQHRPSTAGAWATRLGLSPALQVGARLAVEPGRGRRAVPVRSALVGAVVGVLGVVACATFRAGIADAVNRPARSGVVWDAGIASASGSLAPDVLAALADDAAARGVLDAVWIRAVDVDGIPTPTFGTTAVKGRMPFVVLSGRAPQRSDEIAFAPQTLRDHGLEVGERVQVGAGVRTTMRIVGTALMPETAHTGYDQSAWMTRDSLDAVLGPDPPLGPNDVWDFALVRWRAGTPDGAAKRTLRDLAGDAYFPFSAQLPSPVAELGRLRVLPLALAVFFAILAVATVAHALVTTVRRRRHDLAILRSVGFTARQSRGAIAWQATLLAVAGVVFGVPLGIVAGRAVWRSLAESFPVVYVPPLAVVVIAVVVPAAIAVVNAIAVGPGRAAARIRPADALRVE